MPSFDGSHELATWIPCGFSGTLVTSPFGGVRMRHCQSSVTTDTHVPVRSTGAPARGAGGGPPPRLPRPPPPPPPPRPPCCCGGCDAIDGACACGRVITPPTV